MTWGSRGRVRVVFWGFRGRVRVGDKIRGVIYNKGKDLFGFFVYLPCRPPRSPHLRRL